MAEHVVVFKGDILNGNGLQCRSLIKLLLLVYKKLKLVDLFFSFSLSFSHCDPARPLQRCEMHSSRGVVRRGMELCHPESFHSVPNAEHDPAISNHPQ